MMAASQQETAHDVPSRHPSNNTTSGRSAETYLEKQAESAVQPAGIQLPDDGSVEAGSQHTAADEKLLAWWQAAFYMIAYNISIGILALPKAFSDLGLVGGLIYTVPYSALQYYTSKTLWQVARRYAIYSYPDILGLIFGRYGKYFGHVVQSLLQAFLMAVHVMAFRQAIVAVSAPKYVVCGDTWTFLGAAVMFLASLYRNLKDCAWLAVISCLSIVVATTITIVSVISTGGGVDDHFAFLPDSLLSPSSVGSGISSIVFAFTGHLAYPQIISEMARPEQFPRALKMNAMVQVVMYVLSACIIYWFAGDAVKAPALDSATGILSKLSWGFALPTVVVAGVLPGMMIIKNTTRGIWSWQKLSGSPSDQSWRARAIWIVVAAILWILAPVFAEVVPSFMGVVGVAGAFLGSLISLCFPALAWFRIDKERSIGHRQRSHSDSSETPMIGPAEHPSKVGARKAGGVTAEFWRNARSNAENSPAMAVFNVFLFALGVGLCVFGAYGAISDMASTQQTTAALRPFSCRAPGA